MELFYINQKIGDFWLKVQKPTAIAGFSAIFTSPLLSLSSCCRQDAKTTLFPSKPANETSILEKRASATVV